MRKLTTASLIVLLAASFSGGNAFAQVATCTVTDIKVAPFSWLSSWGKPNGKYFAVKVGDSIEAEEVKVNGRQGIEIKSGLLNYVEGRVGVESDPNEHRGFHFLNHSEGSNKYFDLADNHFRVDEKGPFKIVMKQRTNTKYLLEVNIFDNTEATAVHATYVMACKK